MKLEYLGSADKKEQCQHLKIFFKTSTMILFKSLVAAIFFLYYLAKAAKLNNE